MTSFTAHNIRFADGSVTMPEQNHLLADVPWCGGTKRLLNMIYGGAPAGNASPTWAAWKAATPWNSRAWEWTPSASRCASPISTTAWR